MNREDFIYCEETGNVYRMSHREPRLPIGFTHLGGSSNKKKYKRAMVNGKIYYLHRLIWWIKTGRWPEKEIDHIDGDGCNNRFDNLREVSRSGNMKNIAKSANNASGQYGVTWVKKYKTWNTSITVNRTNIYLGSFKDKSDAIRARKAAEKLYGFHENHGSGL